MLDQLTDEEKFLLLGKVTGSLGPEEEIALERLFLVNPDARSGYEELLSALPCEDINAHLAGRKEHSTWPDLKTRFRERRPSPPPIVKQVPLYKKKWVAAAAVIFIVATGAVLWRQTGKLRKPELAAVPSESAIELKLADGQVVNLSQQQGAINAGAAQLTNNNKSLSYVSGRNPQAAGINTLTVPIGKDYKITLSDGSEVWLNSATKLEFPLSFGRNTREISINGEAYVKVAKIARQPFVVHLPNSSVQVLGTEFNVNTYDSGVVKVALVNGSVNLHAPTGSSILTPGKQAVYLAGQPIAQVIFDARNVLSWRKGLFYFKDASLEEISRVVPRWYGIRVVIDDPAIQSRTFSGVINRNRPIEAFMEDLKVISRIESYTDQEGAVHFK
ncbi:MAG: FecR domain-containing protein [Bacteroidetes bacterium]|nr:FecR domain-containing protein [Bacteroidota bacterium]